MNLLQRFKYTIEADLHQVFDKKEQKNPIAMLNQYIREAEKQTEQTGKLLERQSQLKEKVGSRIQRKYRVTNKTRNTANTCDCKRRARFNRLRNGRSSGLHST